MQSAVQEIQGQGIPSFLIYETINGKPVYYRGFRKVLENELKPDEIMGYGDLQALILNLLSDYFKDLFGKSLWIISGETGLHIGPNSNLSTDLAFYPREALSLKKARNRYIETSPKVVIEIDTKADPESLKDIDYIHEKTQKLLDFGVEQVVWLFTPTQKVMVARPNAPWLTVNWGDPIEIHHHPCSISRILEAAG